MRFSARATEYKGVTFRSRLEATWAMTMDSLAISWRYECHKYEFPDGRWYLPDFYLPEQHSYLEVKGPGVPGREKLYKMEQIETIGDPEGRDTSGLFILGWEDGTFEVISGIFSMLIRCPECGRYYFSGYFSPYPPCLFCDRPQHDTFDPRTESYYKGKPDEFRGEETVPEWKGYIA